MIANALLYAALLPLVVSALMVVVMRQMRAPLAVICPIAVTGGFLAAQITLRSQSGFSESLKTLFQPHEAVDWLPLIVLIALGMSIVSYLAPTKRAWLIALAATLCIAAPVRLLSGNVAQHWSVLGKLAVLISLASLLGAVWGVLATNDYGRRTIISSALQVFVALGAAVVLTQSGVLMYGLSAAALGAAIAGTTLTSLGVSNTTASPHGYGNPSSRGTSGVVTLTLGSLIILAHFYAELSVANMLLLFISLAATAAPFPIRGRSDAAWLRNAVRTVGCLVPLVISVVNVVT